VAHGHSAIDNLIALTALKQYQTGGEVAPPTMGQRFVQRFPSQHEERASEQERALSNLIDLVVPQSVTEAGLMLAAGPVASKAGKVIKGARRLSKVPKNPQKRMEFYGKNIGEAQRGNPERAMVNVQMEMGGGALSYAIEPMGDIINRAYRWASKSPGSLGVAREKVDKVLSALKEPYGFARHHGENLISNARFNNIPVKEYERKVNKALQAYKKAHSELPAHNEVQKLIKEANLAFADQKWNKVTKNLETVRKYMDEGVESWNKRLGK